MVLTTHDRELPKCVTFLYEELYICPKICGFQTHISSVVASTCKTDCSDNLILIRNVSLMICRVLSTGILVKRMMSKLTQLCRDWRFTDFYNCKKWPEFLTNIQFFQLDDSESYGKNLSWHNMEINTLL